MPTSPKNITWSVEKRNVADLIDADYNPRLSNEEQERDLEASVDEFGTVMPVVINIGKRNNVIIGGHFRTRIYRKKGIKQIDVMVPSRELSLQEEKRLNLRLNKNQGSWDVSKLKEMELMTLLEVGFDDTDLQLFFDDVDVLDDGFNVGRALRDIEVADTMPGDTYRMGMHTLVCGDPRTEGQNIANLVQVTVPNDPGKPILEQYQGKRNEKYLAYVRDLITSVATNAAPNAHALVWIDQNEIGVAQQILTDLGFEPKRICLWVGSGIEASKEAFSTACKIAVYATRGKPYVNPTSKNIPAILDKGVSGGNQISEDILDAITIWTDSKPRQDEQYQGKPITLFERPLRRTTAPGDVVYDAYAGAGEVLIAAETLGRTAYLIQPDPKMCDVIVKRWEEFTNKKAQRV